MFFHDARFCGFRHRVFILLRELFRDMDINRVVLHHMGDIVSVDMSDDFYGLRGDAMFLAECQDLIPSTSAKRGKK